MRGSRDETFTCVHCGERFTLSYPYQKDYREKGKSPPRYCRRCYPDFRNDLRSSQRDHQPYATPLPFDPYELPETAVPTPNIEEQPPEPAGQEQSHWWDNPINRNNLALFILVLLTLIVLWFFWQAV